ncbi:MAG: glycosyltransferase, partial [Deltaproteobacteria bacterium]|nr:glycosyltransferase [Deltaproteobacteria bacterium]
MKKLGHEVCVMGPQFFSTIRRPVGLKMIPIPLPGRSAFTFMMYQLLSVLVFPFIVLIHKPDALLLRGGGMGIVWLLELVARLCGVRVISEINGISWSETKVRFGVPFLPDFVKMMASLECRIAHAIIAVTPQIRQELITVTGLPPEKFIVIQNGANPDEFVRTGRDRMRRALGIGADTFVVGYT